MGFHLPIMLDHQNRGLPHKAKDLLAKARRNQFLNSDFIEENTQGCS